MTIIDLIDGAGAVALSVEAVRMASAATGRTGGGAPADARHPDEEPADDDDDDGGPDGAGSDFDDDEDDAEWEDDYDDAEWEDDYDDADDLGDDWEHAEDLEDAADTHSTNWRDARRAERNAHADGELPRRDDCEAGNWEWEACL